MANGLSAAGVSGYAKSECAGSQLMRASLTISLLTVLALARPAVAQDFPTQDAAATVTVRGDGAIQRKPDFARLVGVVSTPAASLKEATDKHNPRAARAIAILQGMAGRGVSIERSDFTLEETSPPTLADGPPPAPQFTAQTSFTIKVEGLDKLDADLTDLVDSGLVEVSASTFEIKDPGSALNDARRAAIVAARRSAEAYAEAGNFRLLNLDKVLDVTPQNFGGLSASSLSARARPATIAIVPPAKLSFHASVVATWRIAPR